MTGKSSYLKHIEDIDRANISTIHKFALNILRKEPFYTGLGTNFKIASSEMMRSQLYDKYLSEFLGNLEQKNPNFIYEIPVPIYDLKKKIIGFADKLLAKSVDVKAIKRAEMGIPTENTLPFFNDIIEDVIVPAEIDFQEKMHDFNSINLNESLILLNNILQKMDRELSFLKIKHLFIDEFQDTDDVQIQVFQLLQKSMRSKCRLFVVGDLKQSIYRFRGARLSAFDLLKKGSIFEWETHYLKINYRTDKRLLDSYESIFENMATNKFLPYKKENDKLSSTVVKDISNENVFCSIPCHVADNKRQETVISVIKEQIKEIEEIIEKRKIHNKSALSSAERTIAVLVRSNWQVEEIVSSAREAGLRIDVKSGGDLFQLESSIDLYKMLLALTNCTNINILANLIESNYINMDFDYSKCSGLDNERLVKELVKSLDQYFQDVMDKTWANIVNEAYTQPVLFVLKELFDKLKPWKKYSNNFYAQKYYIANYEYLIERIIKYSSFDSLTLNQITDYLKVNITTRQQQLARDVDIENDGVKVLCTTIHKSKGLEYDTVILPYTDEDISDTHKVKLEANYSQNELSYTITFDNKVREKNSNYNEVAEEREQISEESRILYVALTRAIRKCIWIENVDSTANISWGTLLEV